MPLHPQVEAFLAQYAQQRMPDLTTIPIDRLRLANELSPQPRRPAPELAQIADFAIAGPGGPLAARLYHPHSPLETLPVCLYFHGGGWVLNSINTHDCVTRRLAAASGCAVLSLDYRLAPEHPYPAAVDDAWAALQWLHAHARELQLAADSIAVAGDSAGANLAAVLCQQSRDRGGPQIAFQALIYPVIDANFDTPSYLENATGYFLTRAEMQWFWDQYVPDANRRREPGCAPLHGSLSQLPPALVITAEYDPLRDEGETYALALQHAGVDVTLHRYPGLIHAFIRRFDHFDAATHAIHETGDALRRAMHGPAF